MPRVRKHLGWVTALVLPGIAAAQTRLSPALATMDIAPAGLTLTKGGDLRFPEGFPGQGSVNDNAAATWRVSNPQGVSLSISFALPTALSGPGPPASRDWAGIPQRGKRRARGARRPPQQAAHSDRRYLHATIPAPAALISNA